MLVMLSVSTAKVLIVLISSFLIVMKENLDLNLELLMTKDLLIVKHVIM